MFAYFAMAADIETLRNEAEVVKIQLHQLSAEETLRGIIEQKRQVSMAAQKKYYDRSQRMLRLGVALGVGSVLSFILGVLFAAKVLSTV
jgi:hypothetical protein